MAIFLNIVSLKCGRFNKRISVVGKTDEEIEKLKQNLNYDKKKFILIVT